MSAPGETGNGHEVHRWTDRSGISWECDAYDHGPFCRLCRRVQVPTHCDFTWEDRREPRSRRGRGHAAGALHHRCNKPGGHRAARHTCSCGASSQTDGAEPSAVKPASSSPRRSVTPKKPVAPRKPRTKREKLIAASPVPDVTRNYFDALDRLRTKGHSGGGPDA